MNDDRFSDGTPVPADDDAPSKVVALLAPNGKRRPKTRPRAPKGDDWRPVIQITTRLHDVVDQSSAVLEGDVNMYQRDARLVRLVRVAEADAQTAGMAIGTPQIRGLVTPTLRERLTALAQFEKFDKRENGWVPCLPTDPVVRALEERGEWPSVRPIVGVIETPSMRPDGTVLDVPGYDHATGYVYLPAREYPPVPRQPDLDAARSSLTALLDPWVDFPFSSESERYVPLAALLTLVARPAIVGACPAFLFDASTRGSGKSLLTRATTTLAHGRESALVTWPSTPEELEKLLGSYALRGASVVSWGNVVGEFGGAPLDKVLTCADRVELRILGRTEVPSLTWRAVILADGNNMVIGGDTCRRVLVARIEPMCERPEERTGFVIPDLIAWCRDHHPRLVCAALTLLRAYVVAGRPEQGLAGWGSFEAWRDLIGSAIAWAGGADVMACRPTIAAKDDDTTSALRAVVEHLPRLAPEGLTCAAMISALYPADRMRGIVPPDGFEALREAIEVLAPPNRGCPPSAQKLGYAFRKARRRVVEGVGARGRYIDQAQTKGRSDTVRWTVREAGQ